MSKRSANTSKEPQVKRGRKLSLDPRSAVALQREGHQHVAVNSQINTRVNLCWIPNGTRVPILEERDGHFRVAFNGREGWSKKYNFIENVPAPGSKAQILVSGCRDATTAAAIRGVYVATKKHHGRQVYKKSVSPEQFIYYWDQRDGPDWAGWWIGPKMGGNVVWSRNPNLDAHEPPHNGWRLPSDGPEDTTCVISPLLAAQPASTASDGSSADPLDRPAAKSSNVAESTQDCVICCESLPKQQFAGKITQHCQHERDVCKSCVARTIELEVTGKGNSTRVLCPHRGCNQVLDHADVRREARKAVFEQFDTLQLKQMLQAEPNFRWCAHRGCGNGQIVEDLRPGETGWNRFMRCQHCQGRTCAHHRCVWHTERTCQQYEADGRSSDEVALLQFFERDGVKRCPKCGHGIEKSSGCDHMTCAKSAGGCGAEFCMRCTADYNGPNGIRQRGNSAHKPSCPWYFPDPTQS